MAKAEELLKDWNASGIVNETIRLNIPAVWKWDSTAGPSRSGKSVLSEPFIDGYEKFNSNTGYTNKDCLRGKKKRCRICFERHEQDDMIAPCSCSGTNKYVHKDCLDKWKALGQSNASTQCLTCKADYAESAAKKSVTEKFHKIMQAVSHWSFHHTHGRYLLCDLQGGVKDDVATLTDPVIMSMAPTKEYGVTDRGPKGISTFFAYHTCNEYCSHKWQKPADVKAYYHVMEGTSMESSSSAASSAGGSAGVGAGRATRSRSKYQPSTLSSIAE